MGRLIGILVLLAAAAVAAGPVPERVVVRGDSVTLADLVPGAPEAWAGVLLGPAPPPGGRRTLEGSWIRQRARQVGARDEIRVPERVVVTRPGQRVDREAVVGAVRRALEPRLGEGEQVRVLGVGLPRALPEGDMELVPRLPGGEIPSPVTLWVDVWVDGARQGRAWARVEVFRSRPVVVVRRDVARGEVLGPDDVEVRAGRSVRGALTDPARAVGKRARRSLRAGATLAAADLETVPVVSRGDLVRLVARVGGVTASTLGRALEPAGLGERLRVENLTSGRTVAGVLREAGVVDVAAGPGR